MVLIVSFLSVITSVVSLSGRCTNAPWALKPRTSPLCPSLSSAGKSTMPYESGFAEVVRHLDAVEREAVSPKELKQRWGPGDNCCDRPSCSSSTFTGQRHLCHSVPLPVFVLYSASIPLAEKGIWSPSPVLLLPSASKITGTLSTLWIRGWRIPVGFIQHFHEPPTHDKIRSLTAFRTSLKLV